MVDDIDPQETREWLDAMEALVRHGGRERAAFILFTLAAKAYEQGFYREVKGMPAVAGVALREVTLQNFRDTMAETMYISIFFNVVFAGIIAFGVVYNSARVSLSERSRELASLRVLGFTRREVAVLLFGEQATLTLAALPLGCLIGYQLCALIARQYQWELFRMPVVVTPKTYAFAQLVVIAAAVGSAVLVRRRLNRLDLVEVLKTRE